MIGKQSRISKHFLGMILMLLMLACMQITVLGGTWKFDGPRIWEWWYVNDDGSYPRDTWSKIDGKWYHFDFEGYLDIGYREFDGKNYLLDERPGNTLGQMRENEIHRTYRVGSDGEVHNYEIMFRHPEADNESYYFKETGASLVDVAKGLGLCGSNPARGYERLFELANLEYRAGFDKRAEDIELMNQIFSNPPTHYEILTFNVKEGEDFYDYLNFAKIYVSDCGRNMDYYYTNVTGGYIGQNRLKVIVYWPNWK